MSDLRLMNKYACIGVLGFWGGCNSASNTRGLEQEPIKVYGDILNADTRSILAVLDITDMDFNFK